MGQASRVAAKGITFDLMGSRITVLPMLVFGFAFDWAWVYSCVLTGSSVLWSDGVQTAAFSIADIMATAALLGLGVLVDVGRVSRDARCLLGAVCRIAGVALLAVAPMLSLGDAARAVLAVLAGVLGGAGSATLLALWGDVLSAPETPSVASNVSLAFAASFVLSYALVNLGPVPVILVAGILLPVAEAVLARESLAALAGAESVALERPRDEALPLAFAGVLAGFLLSAFRELWVTALLLGVADVGKMAIVVGSVTVAGLVMLCLLSYNGGDGLGARIPLGAVCLCVAALLVVDSSDLLYHVVGLFAYYCLEIVSWTALAGLARTGGGRRLFCAGSALLFVGQALTPLSNSFVASMQSTPSMEQVASPTVLVLVLFALLMALSTGDRIDGAVSGLASDAPETILARDAALRSSRIDEVVSRYLLSERESEILRLTADGYSIAGIAEKLCLSENTVKTYMRRLFSKTAVHSRAELMAIVDGGDA